jgi:general secretion pathway protein F
MPRFRYRALRQGGGEVEGELVAADLREAVLHLQSGGSLPVEIAPAAARAPRVAFRARTRGRLSARELVLFTRQLATLLGAGVALDRALTLIAADRGRSSRARLADGLVADIYRGESLSQALGNYAAFSRAYAMVVAAGEARGDLAGALERLAAVLERNRTINQALANALIYPASVLVVACLSVSFLLGFVVPRFSVLLESFRHEPPMAMRLLLAVSGLFQLWGLPFLAVLAALIVFLAVRRRDAGVRLARSRRLLRVPAIGALMAKIETERLTFLLGNMIAAGVALPSALAAARDGSANEALRVGLAEAGRAIERGERVASALAATGVVSDLALELVRVGEETGDLAPMLLKASDILRREIEAATTEWIGLVAPLSMVVLGLIIGAIALAIFGTVLDVYDIAS